MIRTKYKIYGEMNDPNTLIITGDKVLEGSYFMLSTGNKGIRHLVIPPNSVLISNREDGKFEALTLGPNQVIGTDNQGNIVALSRMALNI